MKIKFQPRVVEINFCINNKWETFKLKKKPMWSKIGSHLYIHTSLQIWSAPHLITFLFFLSLSFLSPSPLSTHTTNPPPHQPRPQPTASPPSAAQGFAPSEASPSRPRYQTCTSLRAALGRCKSITVTPRSPVRHVKLFGFAYLGPFGHFFHLLLDKLFKGKKDTTTVAKKHRCC
ncbi:uncharacterized protein LOC132602057 isoform X2 [Lycium barbarum]|uniref:uncharacterized protein LOC132602057 isoform X2 n=1 Tax=Lycium barbarum TaxID=112863 RepID=UPI00293E2CC4|nr:uncharacterized protein LOC132602057 isoform X2 [Lycium barbarum]